MSTQVNDPIPPVRPVLMNFWWNENGPKLSFTYDGDTYPYTSPAPASRYAMGTTLVNTPVAFFAILSKTQEEEELNHPHISPPSGVTILEYIWDFGDGTRGFGPFVTHLYSAYNPNIEVKLSVIDSRRLSWSVSKQLHLYMVPSESIDLTNWKLQLPIGSASKPTKAREVSQPELATFSIDPFFKVRGNRQKSIQFQAPTNGVTTSGSVYPRSELREMNGASLASWTTSSGTHIMRVTQAITSVPLGKKEIMAGQIHDATNDVVAIRLNSNGKLFIDHNGVHGATLVEHYVLGTSFSIEWEVKADQVKTYYNGTLVETYSLTDTGLYFKAGAYTQSNCTTEAEKGQKCGPLNYGEVVITKLQVEHF